MKHAWFAAACVMALSTAAASAQGLRLYEHAGSGTRALVPAAWRAGQPDGTLEGGARFLSPDGSAAQAVWGTARPIGNLHDHMQLLAEAGGIRVTYAPRRRGWFVLSGYRGNRIFYMKAIRACGRVHHVSLEYPARLKRSYDPLVTTISQSLQARC